MFVWVPRQCCLLTSPRSRPGPQPPPPPPRCAPTEPKQPPTHIRRGLGIQVWNLLPAREFFFPSQRLYFFSNPKNFAPTTSSLTHRLRPPPLPHLSCPMQGHSARLTKRGSWTWIVAWRKSAHSAAIWPMVMCPRCPLLHQRDAGCRKLRQMANPPGWFWKLWSIKSAVELYFLNSSNSSSRGVAPLEDDLGLAESLRRMGSGGDVEDI